MRSVFILTLCLLCSATVAFAEARAPWHEYELADTLTMQASDTTEAVFVADCANMTALVYGTGADSVNLVVQGSIDKETWVTITPSAGSITNQSMASGAFIRTVLATNTNAAGAAWVGAGFARYVRLIVKNNCDDTQAAANNTLTGVQAAIVGPCSRR